MARQRKDKVADFVNAVAKWEAANAEGSSLVADIANVKLDAVFKVDVSIDAFFSSVQTKMKFDFQSI